MYFSLDGIFRVVNIVKDKNTIQYLFINLPMTDIR